MKIKNLKTINLILMLSIIFTSLSPITTYANTNAEPELINENPEIFYSAAASSDPFGFCTTTLTPLSDSRLKMSINMNALYTVDKIGYLVTVQQKTLLWWTDVDYINYSRSNVSRILNTHYVSVDSNDDYRLKITYSINDNSKSYYIYETTDDVHVN